MAAEAHLLSLRHPGRGGTEVTATRGAAHGTVTETPPTHCPWVSLLGVPVLFKFKEKKAL